MQTHILYIPGLGDRYDPVRKFALKFWHLKNVSIEFVPMLWRDQTETYNDKIRRVHEVMKRVEGGRIVLVGESAGGSVAVAETMRRRGEVVMCITICGKNVRANRVSPHVFAKNPAFREAMDQVDSLVDAASKSDTGRITVFRSFFDHVIGESDTSVRGARKRRLPAFGHVPAIFATLFFLWPIILREAKR